MVLQNACSEKRQCHRSQICSDGPSNIKPTLSLLFINTFIFTSHAITPDAPSRSRAKHMKTMISGYQDSGVFRKHCLLEPPELFPMDQFSKDETSEVFYKRVYIHSRPQHFRAHHPNTERTHEKERIMMFSCCRKSSMLEAPGLVLTVQNSQDRPFFFVL